MRASSFVRRTAAVGANQAQTVTPRDNRRVYDGATRVGSPPRRPRRGPLAGGHGVPPRLCPRRGRGWPKTVTRLAATRIPTPYCTVAGKAGGGGGLRRVGYLTSPCVPPSPPLLPRSTARGSSRRSSLAGALAGGGGGEMAARASCLRLTAAGAVSLPAGDAEAGVGAAATAAVGAPGPLCPPAPPAATTTSARWQGSSFHHGSGGGLVGDTPDGLGGGLGGPGGGDPSRHAWRSAAGMPPSPRCSLPRRSGASDAIAPPPVGAPGAD